LNNEGSLPKVHHAPAYAVGRDFSGELHREVCWMKDISRSPYRKTLIRETLSNGLQKGRKALSPPYQKETIGLTRKPDPDSKNRPCSFFPVLFSWQLISVELQQGL
jgi:hypothetical protein